MMLLDSFELPSSWSTIQVDEAVKSISTNGKKIPQKEYLSHGMLPVIDQGQDYIGGYTNDITLKIECALPIIIFGDHTRVVKYINQHFAAGADGVKVLESKGYFNVKLLNYFIQYITSKLPSHGYARHYQHLSKESLPLPPLNEQHRIVAKIEELFSELDQGIDSLKTAQAQLKIYRQALLKHAFEGKLTAEWRAQNTDKLESASALQQRIQHARAQRHQQQLAEWEANGKQGTKPKAPKPIPPLTAEELAELPVLPEGWGWVHLEDLVTGVDQGWSPKCEGHPASESEWGVIKTTAIQHGRFDSHENKAIPLSMQPKIQHELHAGDILITRAGPRVRVGVCCLVRTVRDKLMNCDKVYRIRAIDSLCQSDFLEAALNSPRILDAIELIKSGINDSGVNLNQGAFLSLAIPFCVLGEQKFLVQEIESRLAEISQLDQTITTSLQQAEALRQSILKKAFSGELVPQDPNDEPAAALLARIKEQKNKEK